MKARGRVSFSAPAAFVLIAIMAAVAVVAMRTLTATGRLLITAVAGG
jgi:hypothetical protein